MRYTPAVTTSSAPHSAASTPAKSSLMKKVFKLIITLMLTFAPAGVAARLLGVLGRGPLRYILAIVLEPLIRRLLTALLGRHARESDEKITK